jgi:hypothetical protein
MRYRKYVGILDEISLYRCHGNMNTTQRDMCAGRRGEPGNCPSPQELLKKSILKEGNTTNTKAKNQIC